MTKVLVAEKKGEIQVFLKGWFPKDQVLVESAPAAPELREKLEIDNYDLVIWDSGVSKTKCSRDLELLRKLSTDTPQVPIFVVVDDNVDFDTLRSSAFRFIRRPLSRESFCSLIESVLQEQNGVPGHGSRPEANLSIEFEGMVGISLPMYQVFQRIHEAASANIPVLITGETGTGKDLVASAIHKQSKRSDHPYVVVHTGAMPSELVATELFGREKGAYTGAFEGRRGRFEQAHGGTIFLDEIGTMDEKAQVSLLRVLENGNLRRLGGEKDIHVDVRVIAASNENLEEALKEKRFREDLYYRLDVFRIHLPPLRERPGGVTILTNYFISHFNSFYDKKVQSVSPEAYQCLRRYSWPGNVRELKNVIQRAVLMAKGKELTADLIPARVRDANDAGEALSLETSRIHVGMSLEAVEREFIAMTLASTGGNKKQAASILGISRRALYNKLEKES